MLARAVNRRGGAGARVVELCAVAFDQTTSAAVAPESPKPQGAGALKLALRQSVVASTFDWFWPVNKTLAA